MAKVTAPAPVETQAQGDMPAAQVQAAAISLQGRPMLVVVGLNIVQSPGKADMLMADLRARFGGVDVVLMGQDDDGAPHYHCGEAELVTLLADVPIDKMPWEVWPVR